MKRYRACDIVYDTDGHDVKGLPKELEFDVEPGFDPDEGLADLVSERTGWLVTSLNYFEVGEENKEAVA